MGAKGSTRFGSLVGEPDMPGCGGAVDSTASSCIRGRIRIRLAGNIVRLTGAAG